MLTEFLSDLRVKPFLTHRKQESLQICEITGN